jgi:hypothetical protein
MIGEGMCGSYGPDEEWVTLIVRVSSLLHITEAFVRHEPWGREPTGVRVGSIRCDPGRRT